MYDVAELNYRGEKFCEESFNKFYDEYYKKIYNYIFFRIGSSYTAEDLACISMEKIIKNIYRYEESRTQLNTWIFTIVKNTLIDYFRQKSTQNVLFEEDAERGVLDRVSPGIEDCALELERQQMIGELLQLLSERERNVVALKFWGGLKSSEIGAQLNMEEGNVNVIVFRALKKLKQHIDCESIEL